MLAGGQVVGMAWAAEIGGWCWCGGDGARRRVSGSLRRVRGREMMLLKIGGKKARMKRRRKMVVVGNCMYEKKEW